jgi:hypothetical protein
MFLLVVGVCLGFLMLFLSGEMCCFLHFMQGFLFFGVFWRCVEECDLGPAGHGVDGIFLFMFILGYF